MKFYIEIERQVTFVTVYEVDAKNENEAAAEAHSLDIDVNDLTGGVVREVRRRAHNVSPQTFDGEHTT